MKKKIFTLNNPDWHHRKRNMIPANFYLNASKYLLEGILGNLSTPNSCQYHLCMSMHAENILLVVVAMDSESKYFSKHKVKIINPQTIHALDYNST